MYFADEISFYVLEIIEENKIYYISNVNRF